MKATYGIRNVALRYFNAAGADPDGELGEVGRQFLPGKSLARPETGRAFLAKTAHFARQRLAALASPAPNPLEVKDYSYGARKPSLRRTAWWR
jgi:hypothetical protein